MQLERVVIPSVLVLVAIVVFLVLDFGLHLICEMTGHFVCRVASMGRRRRLNNVFVAQFVGAITLGFLTVGLLWLLALV